MISVSRLSLPGLGIVHWIRTQKIILGSNNVVVSADRSCVCLKLQNISDSGQGGSVAEVAAAIARSIRGERCDNNEALQRQAHRRYRPSRWRNARPNPSDRFSSTKPSAASNMCERATFAAPNAMHQHVGPRYVPM